MTEDRTVLITGSNGGLGAGIVDYFLSRGMKKIACHYRSSKENVEGILKTHGLKAEDHCFYAELTNAEEIQQMNTAITEKLGPVSAVINLAGASSNAMSWKMPLEEFRRILDANLVTTFLCCKEFIPHMRESKDGRIVNISSVVAFSGVAGASHYCGAKAGVVGFTRSVALELASKNITVNAIGLGYFDAGLLHDIPENLRETIKNDTPLKRFGEAREIGGLIAYLLSDEGAFATGQVFHVNGGYHL